MTAAAVRTADIAHPKYYTFVRYQICDPSDVYEISDICDPSDVCEISDI
jgi:hypothetical protein